MAESTESKKHPATPLRRRRAVEQGVFPRSQELSVALSWLVGIALMQWGSSFAFERFSKLLTERLGGNWSLAESDAVVTTGWYQLVFGCVMEGFLACSPILLGVFFVILAVHFAQVGFRFNPDRLAWDSARMAPSLGPWKDSETIATLVRGVVKVVLVVFVFGLGIWSRLEDMISWGDLPLERGLQAAWETLLAMGWYLGFGWLLLAILDYGWVWWQHEVRLRMTDSELREELKESQGDSGLRARRRRLVSGA